MLVLNSILAYAIPDVPANLTTQLLREKQLQRELQYNHSDDDQSDGDDDDQDRLWDEEEEEPHYENDFESSFTDLDPESGTGGDALSRKSGRKSSSRRQRRRSTSLSLGQALRMRTAKAASRDNQRKQKKKNTAAYQA